MVNNKKVEVWNTEGLLDHIESIDKNMHDRAFAFILGSGASFSSGIPTGGQLVYRWISELQVRLDPEYDQRDAKEWATEESLGIKGFSYEKAAEFYPQVFQRRFSHDREEGFGYLETVMEGKEPSLGYSIVARVLATTRHKVVITTNFDNLVADASSIYSDKQPMVCGHESLTGFIRPNLRRPLVAKIHRDLLFAPINDPDGTEKLDDGWEEALKNLFRYYTPIVIGYGGNDGSLMGFLNQLSPSDITGGIWWCYREEDGMPNDSIIQTVSSHKGRIIPIIGFDEFMIQLGERFDIPLLSDEIESQAKKRISKYKEQVKTFQSNLIKNKESSPGITQTRKALHVAIEKQQDWWSWELKAREMIGVDNDKAGAIYQQGIEACPESSELKYNYAIFLANNTERYNEVKKIYEDILDSHPDDSSYNCGFALYWYHAAKDLEKADFYFNKAIELDPYDGYAAQSYAWFLYKEKGDVVQSKEIFRVAAYEDTEFMVEYAEFLLKIRLYRDADLVYQDAIECMEYSPYAVMAYAVFTADIYGDVYKSISILKEGLGKNPQEKALLVYLSVLYSVCLKEFDESFNIISVLIQKYPNDPDVIQAMGTYWFESKKDDSKAMRLFERSLEYKPHYHAYYVNAAEAYICMNEPKQALRVLEIAWSCEDVDKDDPPLPLLLLIHLSKVMLGFNSNDELALIKFHMEGGHPSLANRMIRVEDSFVNALDENLIAFYEALFDAVINPIIDNDLEDREEWKNIEARSCSIEF